MVHDIGGPVGFELAAAAPERVRSLTVLNTLVEVDGFRRLWSMEPFARRGIGEDLPGDARDQDLLARRRSLHVVPEVIANSWGADDRPKRNMGRRRSGAGGTRTPDLRAASAPLFQLSYSPSELVIRSQVNARPLSISRWR